MGRVLERDTLSNNTVYQDMLREGRRKGLPVAGVADKRTVEEEEEIQQLQQQVSVTFGQQYGSMVDEIAAVLTGPAAAG